MFFVDLTFNSISLQSPLTCAENICNRDQHHEGLLVLRQLTYGRTSVTMPAMSEFYCVRLSRVSLQVRCPMISVEFSLAIALDSSQHRSASPRLSEILATAQSIVGDTTRTNISRIIRRDDPSRSH